MRHSTEHVERLERELAEARKDSARMDYLQNNGLELFNEVDASDCEWSVFDGNCLTFWEGDTLRAAIDAAMERNETAEQERRRELFNM